MKSSHQQSTASDLTPLLEFGRIINSSLDLQFILSTLLLTVMGKMLVPRGIVLLQREKGWFEIVAAKGFEEVLLGHTIPISKPSRGFIVLDKASRDQKSGSGFFRERQLKIVIPVVVRNKLVGLMSLGQRLGARKYSKQDTVLIRSLVDHSASAIEKAMMIDELQLVNRSLDRKYQELNTLFDLSKEFNVGLDANRVLRLLTFSLLGQIGVNRYAICLIDHGKMSIAASRLDSAVDLSATLAICAEVKTPTLVTELGRRKKFREASRILSDAGISAVIPMQLQNETKGFILLGKKLREGNYTPGDLEFLYSMANLAVISIENARLFRDGIEKQRLEDELIIARDIQQGLLPRVLPVIPGFEIAAVNIPSKQVGGDYYDVVHKSDGELVIAIGDVSGKGTPAALLMANVQAALRALTPMGLQLSDATGRINDLICQNMSPGKFITFFWGYLDIPTRTFRFVNAGHNFPFLLRSSGAIERLEIGGMILGMLKTVVPYEEGVVTFQSGDTLVLFTDGVSEAMNSEGLDYTEERLEQTLREVRQSSPQQILDHVRDELQRYTQDTPQSDDITIVVLKAV